MKPKTRPFLLAFWFGLVAFVLGVLKGMEGEADLAMAAAVLLVGDLFAIAVLWKGKSACGEESVAGETDSSGSGNT
jgi:hypothetical protein